MAKNSIYVCQSCGAVSGKWAGKCASCEEWNTLVEESKTQGGVGGGPKKKASGAGRTIKLEKLGAKGIEIPERLVTGLGELDRVTGGGFVPGSATLVGGEPGIGKSTLLLQTASTLANRGKTVVYLTGEEATSQIRLRAKRLGVMDAPVDLAAETNVTDILSTLRKTQQPPDLVIIDSIQTLWSDTLEAAPGTVSQVRACSQELIQFAKNCNTAIVIVGHVTKDGQIAGPKVVEHMVDTVLYFEGDSGHRYRILRAVKNRYGATDEIGVFEMRSAGLKEVPNPSELFLSERNSDSSGTVVFAGMEGTRPVLVEIQALVAPSHLATPRRAVVGWDQNRLSMILAVLDSHCALRFGTHDVYLNVAGGLKIVEPAADMAVAAALISSLSSVPCPAESVFFGEVSLTGAVRSVSHQGARLKESKKLGFKNAIMPKSKVKAGDKKSGNIRMIDHLTQLTAMLLTEGAG